MKSTCFLSLVNYIIRDFVTASLLMNVFRSCCYSEKYEDCTYRMGQNESNFCHDFDHRHKEESFIKIKPVVKYEKCDYV